jgi:hypothetical protein
MGKCLERKEKGGGGPKIEIKMKKVTPREFQIRKEDAEKHGHTRGGAGCMSWFRGAVGRQPHNDACRERFRGLMRDEARTQLADQKKEEFEKRVEDEMWKEIARKQEREQARGEREEQKGKRQKTEEASGSGTTMKESQEGRHKVRERELEERR